MIIIGRNEGWKLTKCLQSVYNNIQKNSLTSFEVIYIDSNSTDDSISRAMAFRNIKILKITGKTNAALARNIGAHESKGDILFFIDGDMEIEETFLPLVYSEKDGLCYPFITGEYANFYCDYQGKYLSNDLYDKEKKQKNDKYFSKAGGLFLIEKEKWDRMNGMKSKLRVNEDIDLGLRLAANGIMILKKAELLAKHHTVCYNNIQRIWRDLFKGNEWYRSVVLRDNLTNLYAWRLFLRENYSLLILIILVCITIFLNSPLVLFLYPLLIMVRVLKNTKSFDLYLVINRIPYFFFRDVGLILSIFVFWPKRIRNVHYECIINP